MSSVQTTVRSISQTPAINYHIDRHFKKIKRTYSKINRCRVVIDMSKNNSHKGKVFNVRISMTIPGKELSSKKHNQNLFIAIRDSFVAIEQLLEKHHKKTFISNKINLTHLTDFKKHTEARVI